VKKPRSGRTGQFPPDATFPPPDFHTVQDPPESGKRNCWKFFEYWKEIAGTAAEPKDRADLITVKFYRHWPKFEFSLAGGAKRKDKVWKAFTGPMWFEDPQNYVEETMRKLGSGGWFVVINETNVHGELMEAYYKAVDLDTFPVLMDLKMVLRQDPVNADYIEWLDANKVKTPWGAPQEEEEDMAGTGEAFTRVADVLENVTDKLVETTERYTESRIDGMKDELARVREGKDSAGVTEATIAGKTVDMFAGAASKAIDMITQHAGSQFNPIEMMETACRLMKPSDNATEKITQILVDGMKSQTEALKEMQSKQFEFLQTVVMKRNPDGTFSQATNEPVDEVDQVTRQIEKFARLGDALGWKRGSDGGSSTGREIVQHAPPPPPGKSFLEMIGENIVPVCGALTTVITLAANLFYNMRAAPGQGINPAEALAKANAANPMAGMEHMMPGQQQQPPAAAPPPQQPDPRAQWMQFLAQIEGAFRSHFFDEGFNGYTFAEFIMGEGNGAGVTQQGRKQYLIITGSLGRNGLDQLIRQFPPIWNQVQGTGPKYEQFLNEFFGYDEWLKTQKETETAAAV
jgi:hypothetical protein